MKIIAIKCSTLNHCVMAAKTGTHGK